MEHNTSITIRISEDMKKQLEYIAVFNITTVSEVVRNIIEDFLVTAVRDSKEAAAQDLI